MSGINKGEITQRSSQPDESQHVSIMKDASSLKKFQKAVKNIPTDINENSHAEISRITAFQDSNMNKLKELNKNQKESIKNIMQPFTSKKAQFDVYLSKFEPNIQTAFQVQDTYINFRYQFCEINLRKVVEKMIQHKDKLQKLTTDYSEQLNFDQLESDIQIYRDFYEKLKRDLRNLEKQIQAEEEKGRIMKSSLIQQQQSLLMNKNRQNIKLSKLKEQLLNKKDSLLYNEKKEQQNIQNTVHLQQITSDPLIKIEYQCGSRKIPKIKQCFTLQNYDKKHTRSEAQIVQIQYQNISLDQVICDYKLLGSKKQ